MKKLSMKKAFLFALLIICGVLIYSFVLSRVYMTFIAPPIKPITPPTVEIKPIHVPVNIFEGEKHGYAIATPLENKSLGTGYVFTEHPELSGAGPNDAWTVSEIKDIPPPSKVTKKSDVFGAVAIAHISFSPDNRYLAFRTRTVLGAGAYAFTLIVFDLQSGETIHVNAPPKLSSYKGGLGWETFPYIESYEWNGSKLNMVMYTIKFVYDFDTKIDEYLRIEPKQFWQYDLSTNQYTFLKNIDE